MTRRSPAALAAGGLAALAAFLLLIGLGIWQLERRVWKLDLIRHVEAELRAAPISAPPRSEWPAIGPDTAYRRIRVRGTLAANSITLVQAVTDRGPGDWVMTPLRSDQGFTVLINVGFIPADDASSAYRAMAAPRGPLTVTGLLRLTEPHGGFLRANNPAAGRWYSRDVAAITKADGIAGAAPYFIDADTNSNRPGWPVGGLTVVRFANSHLAYAITWFALAALLAVGVARVVRDIWRGR